VATIAEQALAAIRDFETSSGPALLRVVQAWINARKRINQRIDALARPGMTEAAAYETQRLQDLRQVIDEQMTQAAQRSTTPITGLQKSGVKAGADAMEEAIGVSSSFVGVPDRALAALTTTLSHQLAPLMASIAGENASMLKTTLANGVALGKHPSVVAREMRKQADMTVYRANLVARTEMLRAYRSGAQAAIQDAGIDEWVWLSIRDQRTCATCFAMSGNRFPVGVPLDSHPNCFPGGVVVSGPRVVASTERGYTGQLLHLRFQSGSTLTCTPNHPLLTSTGWRKARTLKEGDDAVRYVGDERALARIAGDDHQRPARVEDVARAASGAFGVRAREVPASRPDLHGDGAGSEVYVVRAHGLLMDGFDAALAEPGGDQAFSGGGVRLCSLCAERASLQLSNAGRRSASGGMGSGGVGDVLLGRALARHQAVRIVAPATFDARFAQDAADGGSTDAEKLRDALFARPGLVELDYVVGVDVEWSPGHPVFSLETLGGWHSANGIIASNCRCTQVPYLPQMASLYPEPGDDAFSKLPRDRQLAMLGPGRFDVYQQSNMALSDFVQSTHHGVYGTQRNLRPVKEMRKLAGLPDEHLQGFLDAASPTPGKTKRRKPRYRTVTTTGPDGSQVTTKVLVKHRRRTTTRAAPIPAPKAVPKAPGGIPSHIDEALRTGGANIANLTPSELTSLGNFASKMLTDDFVAGVKSPENATWKEIARKVQVEKAQRRSGKTTITGLTPGATPRVGQPKPTPPKLKSELSPLGGSVDGKLATLYYWPTGGAYDELFKQMTLADDALANMGIVLPPDYFKVHAYPYDLRGARGRYLPGQGDLFSKDMDRPASIQMGRAEAEKHWKLMHEASAWTGEQRKASLEELKFQAESMRTTYFHEFGHHLDMGRPRRPSDDRSPRELLVREMLQTRTIVTVRGGDSPWASMGLRKLPKDKIEYYTSDNEMIARLFAQKAAVRSGMKVDRWRIDNGRFFSDVEFKRLEPLLDKYLDGLGVLPMKTVESKVEAKAVSKLAGAELKTTVRLKPMQPYEAETLLNDWIKKGGEAGRHPAHAEEDSLLAAIYDRVGAHAKPTYATFEQVDTLVGEGFEEVWRGGGHHIEDFMTGERHYAGTGIYGDGTYMFSMSKSDARTDIFTNKMPRTEAIRTARFRAADGSFSYSAVVDEWAGKIPTRPLGRSSAAKAWDKKWLPIHLEHARGIVRGVIKNDAKIATKTDLANQRRSWYGKLNINPLWQEMPESSRDYKLGWLMHDDGRFAAMLGYDGYFWPPTVEARRYRLLPGETRVILNRGALVMVDHPVLRAEVRAGKDIHLTDEHLWDRRWNL
jgi:SPP1 gp7 family putative phage head morphogenesis protein